MPVSRRTNRPISGTAKAYLPHRFLYTSPALIKVESIWLMWLELKGLTREIFELADFGFYALL